MSFTSVDLIFNRVIDGDDTPATGVISVQLSAPISNSGTTFSAVPISQNLDSTGHASFALVANTDSGTLPQATVWNVTEQINDALGNPGKTQSYSVQIVPGDAPSVNVDSLEKSAPVPTTIVYLPRAGGSDYPMLGPLYLPGDPTEDLEAATKEYVDNSTGDSVPLSWVGQPDGVASLDDTGNVPADELGLAVAIHERDFDLLQGPQTVDRTGVTDASVALQANLNAAAAQAYLSMPSAMAAYYGNPTVPRCQTAYLPDGLYKLNNPLDIPVGVPLIMAPDARLQANGALAYVLGQQKDGSGNYQVFQDQPITGGVIDANGQAAIGVYLPLFASQTLDDVTIYGYQAVGVQAGDQSIGSLPSSYELKVDNLHTWPSSPSASLVSGSKALWLNNATDSFIARSILTGALTGVRNDSGDSVFSQVHAWGFSGRGNPIAVCFDDNSSNAQYFECYADTPTEYGWVLRNQGTRIVGGGAYMAATGTTGVAVAVYIDGTTDVPVLDIRALRVVGAGGVQWANDLLFAASADTTYSATQQSMNTNWDVPPTQGVVTTYFTNRQLAVGAQPVYWRGTQTRGSSDFLRVINYQEQLIATLLDSNQRLVVPSVLKGTRRVTGSGTLAVYDSTVFADSSSPMTLAMPSTSLTTALVVSTAALTITVKNINTGTVTVTGADSGSDYSISGGAFATFQYDANNSANLWRRIG